MATLLNYQTSPAPIYRRSVFLCAFLAAASVFPLIWMGGIVTTKGAGLSVPDWPNSYGYNMFLYPPSKWIGGIFYEHTHRLLGTLSGFLTVALVLIAWGPARKPSVRYGLGVFTIAMFLMTAVSVALYFFLKDASQMAGGLKDGMSHVMVLLASLGLVTGVAWCSTQRDERRWFRWLTILQLILICVQGTLGGQRVNLVNLSLAMIHACLAQGFFCLAAFTALASSKWWHEHRGLAISSRSGQRTTRLGYLAILIIFAQLIAGAIMRHNNAGLAIPDLPLAFGKLIPPTDHVSLDAANQIRNWHYHLDGQMTLGQVWMHFSHRIGAVLATIAILALVIGIFRNLAKHRALFRLAVILSILIVTQLTLGVLTVVYQKPADIATLHVAVGALTLMVASVLTAVSARLFSRAPAISAEGLNDPAGNTKLIATT